MRILEVSSENFMASKPTRLRFPRTGVVVVSGANGASKSSLIEMVSVALFGKTLRGTPWWPHPKEGPAAPKSPARRGRSIASVVTDVVRAERERVGSKNTLAWGLNEEEDAGRVARSSELLAGVPGAAPSGDTPTYETAGQAQAAMEGVIGSFDAWRRCSAFSSSDASHFSSATDGERKRLLEAMLGLERFDEALGACREDIRVAEQAFRDAHEAHRLAGSQLDTAKARLEQASLELQRAREAVPAGPTHVHPSATPAGLEGALRAAKLDLDRVEALHGGAVRAHAEAELIVRQARRAEQQFAAGACPTCGQDASSLCGDLAASRADVEAGEARLLAAVRTATTDRDEARWLFDGLRDRRVASVSAQREAENLALARRQALTRVSRVEADVVRLRDSVGQWKAAVLAAQGVLDARSRRVRVLLSAEFALGLRGIRAHLLAKALDGLSAVANVWLSRLGLPDLKVSLRPYTEKKSGGGADAISLDIEGAGDGYGYRAASGGERRRVDVALLLALAEVGQAAAGQTGSTLFFDECMDALDEDGTAALVEALEDLSHDRCVFLVTHRTKDLAPMIRAAMRIHVEDGVLHVRDGNGNAVEQEPDRGQVQG